MIVVIAVILWLTGIVGDTLGTILVIGAVAVEGVEIWLWIKYLKRFRVKTGVEAMMGESAIVAERCDPEGTVRMHGEIWRAHCEPGASPGQTVVVREVDGLLLRVGPADEGDRSGVGQSSFS